MICLSVHLYLSSLKNLFKLRCIDNVKFYLSTYLSVYLSKYLTIYVFLGSLESLFKQSCVRRPQLKFCLSVCLSSIYLSIPGLPEEFVQTALRQQRLSVYLSI